jgi:hypothetical protein
VADGLDEVKAKVLRGVGNENARRNEAGALFSIGSQFLLAARRAARIASRHGKPLPRPLWQNEAKKPRSLKRLQPGADGNRGKLARPNHRDQSGTALAATAWLILFRNPNATWLSRPHRFATNGNAFVAASVSRRNSSIVELSGSGAE